MENSCNQPVLNGTLDHTAPGNTNPVWCNRIRHSLCRVVAVCGDEHADQRVDFFSILIHMAPSKENIFTTCGPSFGAEQH
mmetsp:Transcript_36196/g.60408  ORF Transcript_36196/g.60408 Transcript_36196/m.60408 type:complete len:80 (+) Transcript_36196:3-242(+)